jgi:hypothetical protein
MAGSAKSGASHYAAAGVRHPAVSNRVPQLAGVLLEHGLPERSATRIDFICVMRADLKMLYGHQVDRHGGPDASDVLLPEG